MSVPDNFYYKFLTLFISFKMVYLRYSSIVYNAGYLFYSEDNRLVTIPSKRRMSCVCLMNNRDRKRRARNYNVYLNFFNDLHTQLNAATSANTKRCKARLYVANYASKAGLCNFSKWLQV